MAKKIEKQRARQVKDAKKEKLQVVKKDKRSYSLLKCLLRWMMNI